MKQRIIPLLLAACMTFCAGCTKGTSHNTEDSSHNDVSTNFLGGSGNLEVIDIANSLTMQDDDWFYIGSEKIQKGSNATPQLVSQCREAGCTHDSSSCVLNQYYSGSSTLMSDGKALYLKQLNQLFTIDSQGDTHDFLTLEKDSDGTPLAPDGVSVDVLRYIDDSHVFIYVSGYTEDDEYAEMSLIYNSKSNEIYSIEHDIYQYDICVDLDANVLYSINSETDIVKIDLSDMSEEIVTQGLDDFPTFNGWTVENNVLYYINQMGQYCRFDLQSSTKTVLYDESPFYTYAVHSGKVYAVDQSRTSILCGNVAWTESEVCCTTETTINGITAIGDDVLFLYCEDGGRILYLETGELVQYKSGL